MNIIVCVKQVIDPEAPPQSFQIDSATNRAEMRGASPVIDPYGEYAVEAALKIKDTVGGKITIITMGNNLLREVVKKPLAMGADELILLEDEAYESGDSWTTAQSLAAAIKKVAEYDLILFGREASDTNAGQAGPGIAEILGVPCISIVRKIDINEKLARIERVTTDGYEVIEVNFPVVVTISNEIGEPRYPTIKGIMGAKRIEPIVWKPGDIGLGPANVGVSGRKAKTRQLFQPEHEVKCEMIEGETPEESAENLATKLREAKIL